MFYLYFIIYSWLLLFQMKISVEYCGSWIDWAGKFSFLTHVVKCYNSLLDKVIGNDPSNHFLFLISSVELIFDLKKKVSELNLDNSKNIYLMNCFLQK